MAGAALIAAAFALIITIDGGSAQAAPIRSFASCSDLLEYYRQQALQYDDVYGYATSEEDEWTEEEVEEEAMEEAEVMEDDAMSVTVERQESSASSAPADGGEVSETGTNVQVRGVDESDIVKTDGQRVYVLHRNALEIANIVEGGPVEFVGQISFDDHSWRQELLISGGKALVVRQLEDRESPAPFDLPAGAAELLNDRDLAWIEEVMEQRRVWRATTQVLELDISEASAPQMLRTLTLDGTFASARLVDGNARVIFHHYSYRPRLSELDWLGERYDQDFRAQIIADAQLSTWHPLYGLEDFTVSSMSISGRFDQGYAVACDRTHATERPWRAEMSYLLTFDLAAASGISEWGSAAVMADSATVYATTDALYLAAPDQRWSNTDIHRFDLSDASAPVYDGSGQVAGTLLSQWALSEHDGYLRIATTHRDRWPTVSSVFVLQPTAGVDGGPGALEQVGFVSGLGVTEEIYAVRFAGPLGYVVTFRQVDPLYVLDLSDPTNPQSVGELKIPGFSRYLHPIGDGLLLGVGHDADERTGWQENLQVSLFDVSDPTDPQQISVIDLGEAHSPIESDHRAFRYADGVAWIPAGPSDWYGVGYDGAFFGIRVHEDMLVHEATLRLRGRASRTLPIGDQIHLLSDREIRTYALSDYSNLGGVWLGGGGWDPSWTPKQPSASPDTSE